MIFSGTIDLYNLMKQLNIREMRSVLGKLDVLVEDQQELIITRNKQAIARVLPIQGIKNALTMLIYVLYSLVI